MWDIILLPLKHFFEWAKLKKRYPLLFPFSLIFLYLFINNYFQTRTFKNTIDHEYFLIFAGVILGVTGITYALILRKRNILRYSVGGLFFILGFALIVLVFFQRISPKLPDDTLIISVAEFDYAFDTKATRSDSINMQAFIYNELNKRKNMGVPIDVKKPQHLVEFGNEIQDGAIRAKKLGTSRKGAAHIVVWGQLGKYGEKLWIIPIITICQPFGNIRVKEVNLDPLYKGQMPFPKRDFTEIGDVLTIISGLAFFANGLYTNAIICFKNPEGLMEDLIPYVEKMKAINPTIPQHKMVIYNTFGMVYQRLAQYQTAREFFNQVIEIDGKNYAALNNLALCDMALKHYNEAIQKFEKLFDQTTNPVVLSNLAFCNFELGNTVKAIEQWEESLDSEKMSNKYDILDAKAGLSLGYFEYGKIDEAVSLFKEVVIQSPSYRDPIMLKRFLWPDKAILTSQKILQNIN